MPGFLHFKTHQIKRRIYHAANKSENQKTEHNRSHSAPGSQPGSQIFTYLACSLKYKFQYVEQRLHERVSIALMFGSAIHAAIERYYRSLKENGFPHPLWQIQDLFADSLNADLDNREIPILYKKETPNREATIQMGKGLLKAFYEGIDMTGFEVAGSG